MPKLRAGRGGSENTPAAEPPVVNKAARPEVELRKVVYDLLLICEGFCEAGPDPRRVDLRNLKGRLRAAFPRDFKMSQTDLAWELEEDTNVDG